MSMDVGYQRLIHMETADALWKYERSSVSRPNPSRCMCSSFPVNYYPSAYVQGKTLEDALASISLTTCRLKKRPKDSESNAVEHDRKLAWLGSCPSSRRYDGLVRRLPTHTL